MSTSYEVISQYMTERLRTAMLLVPNDMRSGVTEVRLRSGRPITYIYPDLVRYLSGSGKAESKISEQTLIVSPREISKIIEYLCHFSLHTHSRELTEGCFVIENGVRVGACGTKQSENSIISDFSALNFRISREVIGCADKIFPQVFGKNVLICGGVNSGKTTMLRDLCRQFGDICKVALVDERNEISASIGGIPNNKVGLMTDVMVGCRRSTGITSAVRTLSPDYIFCDEISDTSDSAAMLQAHGCGVKFAATIHAENYDQLLSREVFKELHKVGFFDLAVFLSGSDSPSKVREIRRIGNAD